MYYSVQLTKNRSVLWADENWYESCEGNNFVYTLEEVKQIIQLMKKHFQYFVTVLGQDGSEANYEFGKEVTAQSVAADLKKEFALGDPDEMSLF